MTLAPGESTNEFSGHLQPNSTEGVSIIKYTFFEVGNPSNASSVIVHYNSLFSVSSEAGDSAISDHIRFFFGSANQDLSGMIKIHNHGSNPQNIIALRGAQNLLFLTTMPMVVVNPARSLMPFSIRRTPLPMLLCCSHTRPTSA